MGCAWGITGAVSDKYSGQGQGRHAVHVLFRREQGAGLLFQRQVPQRPNHEATVDKRVFFDSPDFLW